MHFRPQSGLSRLGWLSLAVLATCLSGCSSFKLPSFNAFGLSNSKPKYVGLQPGFESDVALSQEIYNKVREARAQNSIVLQIVGDESPVRVLPLPPEQKSVFVSDLLNQTGVQNKLGAIDVVLYRHATGTIGGIRMEVKMANDKRSVRAESDYALHAGDRLRVEKAPHPGLEKLIRTTLGL